VDLVPFLLCNDDDVGDGFSLCSFLILYIPFLKHEYFFFYSIPPFFFFNLDTNTSIHTPNSGTHTHSFFFFSFFFCYHVSDVNFPTHYYPSSNDKIVVCCPCHFFFFLIQVRVFGLCYFTRSPEHGAPNMNWNLGNNYIFRI
jgi:hypothetical protein